MHAALLRRAPRKNDANAQNPWNSLVCPPERGLVRRLRRQEVPGSDDPAGKSR
jgi:hypothetical protein